MKATIVIDVDSRFTQLTQSHRRFADAGTTGASELGNPFTLLLTTSSPPTHPLAFAQRRPYRGLVPDLPDARLLPLHRQRPLQRVQCQRACSCLRRATRSSPSRLPPDPFRTRFPGHTTKHPSFSLCFWLLAFLCWNDTSLSHIRGAAHRPAHPQPASFLPQRATTRPPSPSAPSPPLPSRETSTPRHCWTRSARLVGARRIRQARTFRSGVTLGTSPNSSRTRRTRCASISGDPSTTTTAANGHGIHGASKYATPHTVI